MRARRKPLWPGPRPADPPTGAQVVGHGPGSRRGDLDGGSRIGARYRHSTPEMAVRVAAAIQLRLEIVVPVAEAVLETDGSGGRVF